MNLEETRQPTLLLVDDDQTFCNVLKEALEHRGFAVFAAYDLEEGMALAEQHLPEYAVIDLRIGLDSGLELVKKLVSLDVNTACVMLTGFASIATAVEAIKLGAIHYLTKPTDTDEIVAALTKTEGDPGVAISKNPPTVKRMAWEHIQNVLQQNGGNISAAARALNIDRRSLQRKLVKKPVKD